MNSTMIDHAQTEGVNPRSRKIDLKPTSEILAIINAEDASVAQAVQRAIPEITPVVDAVAERIARGGRLIYVGVGTSGRLAVQDAAECPPTYGVSPETVTAIIAGGMEAMMHPIESAEDDASAGAAALREAGVDARCFVLGISANGNASYVCGALEEARKAGAATGALLCNPTGRIERFADIAIHALTGPEVICGSTRMKAGTAQKMILNMISTAVMIKCGRVTGNFMTAMTPVNAKLRKRAVFIVEEITSVSAEEAQRTLEENGYDIRESVRKIRENGEKR